jgi:hypothetical protein
MENETCKTPQAPLAIFPESVQGHGSTFPNPKARSGAQWKSQPVERFTGGTATQRSGDGLNWRSQAPKAADVSLKAAFGDPSAFEGYWQTFTIIVILNSGLGRFALRQGLEDELCMDEVDFVTGR